MTAPLTAVSPVSSAAASAQHAKPERGLSFHEVLSALNPLQYLPVIGTIYRAVTGDIIPEPIRRLGSLIVSGLMGGPVGIAINIATMAAEKITGIDLDRTGQAMLHGEPVGQAVAEQSSGKPEAAAAVSPQAAAHAPAPASAHAAPPAAAKAPVAWSAAQLAAYGVQAGDGGTLRMGGLQGADVLNTLELAQLRSAHAAYAQVAALAQ